MITLTSTIVIVDAKGLLQQLGNFEGIQLIRNAKQIPEVWRCNKTPAILKRHARSAMAKYPWVKATKSLIKNPDKFIAFCHESGFECGELVSRQKVDTSTEECFLCNIANLRDQQGHQFKSLAQFNQFTPEVNDVIIMDSENFFVKIELGCLDEGMLMICTKKHYLSAAQMPASIMAEYQRVKEDVELLLKKVFGEDKDVIFFEHGSAPDGMSSHKRSVVHMHVHVYIGKKFEQKYLDMVCLKEISDIRMLSNTKYLSYQVGANGPLLAVSDPKVYVQRQYPRQIIALMLGIPYSKANWRHESFMDLIIKTFDHIHSHLERNQDSLPQRIVQATAGFVEGYPKRAA